MVKNMWRTYELLVYKYFCKMYERKWQVDYDVKIEGKSKRKRQMDILLQDITLDIKVIIDCKHYNTKIKIKDVECMIGMMDDLKANHGIMVTLKGFQKGAVERAKEFGRLKLKLLKLNDLFPLRFYKDEEYLISCPNCDSSKDIFTGNKIHYNVSNQTSDVVFMNDTEGFIKVYSGFCNSCLHQIFICTECKTKITLAFDDIWKKNIKYCNCGIGYSFYAYKNENNEVVITYAYFNKDGKSLLSETNVMNMESMW